MKVNTELRDQIFEIVENQIASNNPPEAKITFSRLIAQGYSEFESKQLIGQCLVVEMFSVINQQKPFNEDRYVKNLKRLPKEPLD